MKLIFKILFAGSSLVVGATAFADNMMTATPNQALYGGVNAGFGSTYCSTCSVSRLGTGSTSNTGLAADLFAGYQLNSYVAFEAGVGSLPAGRSSITLGTADNTGLYSDIFHAYGAIKAMLPLQNQFGVFAKLGYDAMVIDSNDNLKAMRPTGVFLAVGGSYTLNKNLAATLSYNQILDSASDGNINVGYGTLGLIFFV